jgi:SAM-dependent methyltransferase
MQTQAVARSRTECDAYREAAKSTSLVTPARQKVLAFASLRPGEFVLDVGCGAGALSISAARLVHPDGWVAAVDTSDMVVNQARVEAAAHGIGNIGFLRMHPEDLHFREGLFDAALCCLGLSAEGEPVAALREMRRVLRPGGRAAVAVWGGCHRPEGAASPLGAGNTLAATVLGAGFRDVRVERLRVLVHDDSGSSDPAGEFVVAAGRKPELRES